MLTKKQAHELFDYKDGMLFWKVRPANNIKLGSKAGSRHHSNYIYITFNKSNIAEHRIIFLMHHGYFPQQVDHIDGNRKNNSIENLRAATPLTNAQNAKVRKDNTSGAKGVNWNKSNNQWRVRVQVNNKRILIGDFKDLELAELVAQEARNKYHGNFAKHN
jgi:hypothetical protein